MKRRPSRGHRRVFCGRKQRYGSQVDAHAAAAGRTGNGAPRLRAYECDRCKGWHLTKQAGPDFAALAQEGDTP